MWSMWAEPVTYADLAIIFLGYLVLRVSIYVVSHFRKDQ